MYPESVALCVIFQISLFYLDDIEKIQAIVDYLNGCLKTENWQLISVPACVFVFLLYKWALL